MKSKGLKVVSTFVLILVAASALGAAFFVHPAAAGDKVYVCKYVNTPGEGERLQTGQNPIEVSVNAIKDWPVAVGASFADAQGRSYVLGFVPMNPEPDRDSCPQPTPTPTFIPTNTFTFTSTSTEETEEPTDTYTPTDTFTYTPTDTETPTLTNTPVNTPTSTFTPTETEEPTDTLVPTTTKTFTPSPRFTFRPTETEEPTNTGVFPTSTSTIAPPGGVGGGGPLSLPATGGDNSWFIYTLLAIAVVLSIWAARNSVVDLLRAKAAKADKNETKDNS